MAIAYVPGLKLCQSVLQAAENSQCRVAIELPAMFGLKVDMPLSA
jgi:hypothetical protein